jgi:hypothetical protein
MVRCQGYGPAKIQPHMAESVNANNWCSECLAAYNRSRPKGYAKNDNYFYRKMSREMMKRFPDFTGPRAHLGKAYNYLLSKGMTPGPRREAVEQFLGLTSGTASFVELKTLAELLMEARNEAPRDERGYQGPSENATERPPADNKWIDDETIQGVEAYVLLLRQFGRYEAAAQLLRDAAVKRETLKAGGRTKAVGRDYDTVHYFTDEPVKLEFKSEYGPTLTRAQGFPAYNNPAAYIFGIIIQGEVNFFDSKGSVVNRREVIKYEYDIRTVLSMEKLYIAPQIGVAA